MKVYDKECLICGDKSIWYKRSENQVGLLDIIRCEKCKGFSFRISNIRYEDDKE